MTFEPLLRRAMDAVPGAYGAVFADWTGESVAEVGPRDEMRLMAAHESVILGSVQRWMHLLHYGEAEELILRHERVDLLVHVVTSSYFVVMALHAGSGHLGSAITQTRELAAALGREIA